MRETDLKPLEDLFREEVFKFLKKEGKITDEIIRKLRSWKHSGFSVDNGVRISQKEKGCESVAQYILRNPFSAGKITYIAKTGKVIYHSKMKKGENRKNFMINTAEEVGVASLTPPSPLLLTIFPRSHSRW